MRLLLALLSLGVPISVSNSQATAGRTSTRTSSVAEAAAEVDATAKATAMTAFEHTAVATTAMSVTGSPAASIAASFALADALTDTAVDAIAAPPTANRTQKPKCDRSNKTSIGKTSTGIGNVAVPRESGWIAGHPKRVPDVPATMSLFAHRARPTV